MKRPHVLLGSVSTGTLNESDLIGAFTSELHYYHKRVPRAPKDDSDFGDYVVELFDALDAIAPPFCYFGTLDGDGADFGFWFDLDSYKQSVSDGEIVVFSDLADVPSSFIGTFSVVSDHGNIAIYYRSANHRTRSLISIV